MASLLILRRFASTKAFPRATHRFRSLSSSSSNSPQPTSVDPIDVSSTGEKLLFESDQYFTIRMMLGGVATSVMYWSYHLIDCYLYPGEIASSGFAIMGNPAVGVAGLGLSGFCLYTTRHYANVNVKRAYESPDGRRIGFQMHNIYGSYGRKLEALPSNLKFTLPEEKNLTNSSLARMEIIGAKTNVFIDITGKFYGTRLRELMNRVTTAVKEDVVKDKEARVEILKGTAHQHKRKRHSK